MVWIALPYDFGIHLVYLCLDINKTICFYILSKSATCSDCVTDKPRDSLFQKQYKANSKKTYVFPDTLVKVHPSFTRTDAEISQLLYK